MQKTCSQPGNDFKVVHFLSIASWYFWRCCQFPIVPRTVSRMTRRSWIPISSQRHCCPWLILAVVRSSFAPQSALSGVVDSPLPDAGLRWFIRPNEARWKRCYADYAYAALPVTSCHKLFRFTVGCLLKMFCLTCLLDAFDNQKSKARNLKALFSLAW